MSTKEVKKMKWNWLTVGYVLQEIMDYALGLSVLTSFVMMVLDRCLPDMYVNPFWMLRFADIAGILLFVKGIQEMFSDNGKSKYFVGAIEIILGGALAFMTSYALFF